jgi:hypothetical protein
MSGVRQSGWADVPRTEHSATNVANNYSAEADVMKIFWA